MAEHREERRIELAPISAGEQLVHVLVLFGFGIAQPLYDLLGRDPTFFVYRRAEPIDFLLFVSVVSIALPAALFAGVELLGLPSRPLRAGLRAALVALLAALIPLLPATRVEGVSPWAIVAVTVGVGAAIAYARQRFRLVRQFLTVLVPAVVLFPLVFLFRDGVRDRWLGSEGAWVSGGAGSGVPIVLVVYDALPTASLLNERHEIDRVRYPSFGRLAEVGTWYRRATTVDAFTNRAVPAILTGMCPSGAKTPVFQEFPRNLFTHASDANRIEAVETVTDLCPDALCAEEIEELGDRFSGLLADASIGLAHALLPRPWRDRLPSIEAAWGDFRPDDASSPSIEGGRRDEAIGRFDVSLSRLSADSPPPLFFAHLVLPHRPFIYLPSGRRYRLEQNEPDFTELWARRHTYQRHLLQLAYADALLGRLLDRLESIGLFDESMIVVTADHGASFRLGQPPRSLGDANAVDILSVPLLIKRPHQRSAEVRDDAVQTVDILPTIADAASLTPPDWVDGQILGRAAAGSSDLSCPNLRAEAAPTVTLADLLSAADTKLQLFGSGGEVGKFPAHRLHTELLGVPVSSSVCPGLRSDLAVLVENGELYESVEPASRFVPAEVSGFIKGPDAGSGIDLALAVNGRVGATTRSYRSGGAQVFPWRAIVPEETLQSGKNDVALFAVRPAGEECRLDRLGLLETDWVPSLLGIRLGAWPVLGVEEVGFGNSFALDGTTVRRLKRRASIRIPLPRQGEPRPNSVRLDLEVLDPAGAQVTVRIDGLRRFRGQVPVGRWVRMFPLDVESLGESLTVTIRSVGAGTQRKRKNGMALHGIFLLTGVG